MKRGPGCLFLLLILGALSLELWLFLLVCEWTRDVVGPLAVVLILSFIGVRTVGFHLRRLPMEFLSGNAGRRFIGVIGGVLLAFPGFGTAVLGLPLLLPPVQILLARWGGVIAGSMLRNVMKRMGGGMGGFPGGPFPGMQPRSGFPGMIPDDQVRPGTGKVIDTTVERDP